MQDASDPPVDSIDERLKAKDRSAVGDQLSAKNGRSERRSKDLIAAALLEVEVLRFAQDDTASAEKLTANR